MLQYSDEMKTEFPHQYQFYLQIETKVCLPFEVEASVSFSTEDRALHFGRVGKFTI